MDRRQFIKCSTLPFFLQACSSNSPAVPTSTPFSKLLAIPAEVNGELRDGKQQYDLTIQQSSHTFFNGFSTSTFGVNGSFLGPSLRLMQGADVSINYSNQLSEETTMHGHGMHLPAIMDGGPHQIIPAASSWSAQYTVNQPASTNWYHPHVHGNTGEQVYKGLAGLIYVDDGSSQTLNLPRTYGVDDIPLVLQDRRFNTNGQLQYIETNQDITQGMKGDTHLVNGVIQPYHAITAGLVRLRILNGANARVYRLALSNSQTFQLIASDNGLLAAPVTLPSIEISPGERAEIVVDFSGLAGGTVELIDSNNSNIGLIQFQIAGTLSATTTTVPASLASITPLGPLAAVVNRSFVLSMQGAGAGGTPQFYINSVTSDLNRTDFTMNLGDIEIWEVSNITNMTHNFHTHATYFQIIERNGSAATVGTHEKGLKDTVLLKAGESVKLIIKMTDYTDATGHYMYHCHILEHEDRGMMGQFVVT